MAEFLQFLFSGLTVGAIYALVALGFTLIYNASDVVNFAQGEFVMIGGMVTVLCGRRRRSAAACRADCARRSRSGRHCAASARDRAGTRAPPPVTLIIITIGASIFLRGVAAIVFDKNFHRLSALCRQRAVPHRRARRCCRKAFVVLAGAASSWSRCGRS